jgi:hypothetical protein
MPKVAFVDLLPNQIHGGQIVFPIASTGPPIDLCDAPRPSQQQSHRHVGGTFAGRPRCIAYGDTPAGGGFDVDTLDAAADDGDNLQTRRRLQQGGIHFVEHLDHQSGGVDTFLLQNILRHRSPFGPVGNFGGFG